MTYIFLYFTKNILRVIFVIKVFGICLCTSLEKFERFTSETVVMETQDGCASMDSWAAGNDVKYVYKDPLVCKSHSSPRFPNVEAQNSKRTHVLSINEKGKYIYDDTPDSSPFTIQLYFTEVSDIFLVNITSVKRNASKTIHEVYAWATVYPADTEDRILAGNWYPKLPLQQGYCCREYEGSFLRRAWNNFMKKSEQHPNYPDPPFRMTLISLPASSRRLPRNTELFLWSRKQFGGDVEFWATIYETPIVWWKDIRSKIYRIPPEDTNTLKRL